MQCPRCHAHTLVFQKSQRVCKVPQCYYEDQHPISYENDVRHYEGQKGGENRFSTLYSSALDHGGINVDKEANNDKQLKKGLKYIKDICLLLKLSQKIQNTAEARFITILRLQIKEKLQMEEKIQKIQKLQKIQKIQKINKIQKQSEEDENKQIKKKVSFSIKQLACYSIYSACFENQNYFEDYNLSSWLKLTKKKWDSLLKHINNQLKNKIDFIPVEKPMHFIVRVCRKRKIDQEEEQAMIRMCSKISQKGIQDGCNRKTVAACVFWKICQNSKKYRNQIRLQDICRKHNKNLPFSEQQKYFDINPETIKKFFNEKMQKDLNQIYLPKWNGRIDQ